MGRHLCRKPGDGAACTQLSHPQTRSDVCAILILINIALALAHQRIDARYNSVNILYIPSAMWLNLPGLLVLVSICMGCGVVIYATYRGCDPLLTKDISTTSQLIAFFVMQVDLTFLSTRKTERTRRSSRIFKTALFSFFRLSTFRDFLAFLLQGYLVVHSGVPT